VSRVSRTTSSISQRAAVTVRSGFGTIREGLGRQLRPVRREVPVVATAPAALAAPSPAVSRQGGASPPAILSGDFAGLPRGTPVSAAPSSSVPLSQGAPTPPVGATASPNAPTYSAADAALVRPPVLISPRVAVGPPAGTNAPPPQLELVVSASGEVESIRLASGQLSALSGMQISAVKAWRFQPATRNGLPVRYRLRVPLPAK
jgi:periplasmic protein TonB